MRAGYKEVIRSNRGNALILAVLIILLLSSAGVVSVQRTNADLMVAGNITRSTQAFLASDAGMQHALALVGNNTVGYLAAVGHQKGQGAPTTTNDVTYPIVDATTAAVAMPPTIAAPLPGDPQPENLWISTVDSGTFPKATMLQNIAYHVTATWVSEVPGLAGYSKDADICNEVFDFNSQAGIPARIETAAQTMSSTNTNTVVVTSRTRAITGPCRCQHQ